MRRKQSAVIKAIPKIINVRGNDPFSVFSFRRPFFSFAVIPPLQPSFLNFSPWDSPPLPFFRALRPIGSPFLSVELFRMRIREDPEDKHTRSRVSEHVLNYSVFKRVKRDNHQPCSCIEDFYGFFNEDRQIVEFVVNRDPKCLKSLGCGVRFFSDETFWELSSRLLRPVRRKSVWAFSPGSSLSS